MTIDTLSEIVAQTLGTPDLSKLTATDIDKSHGHKKAIVSLIPYVGGLAAEELQQYYDYRCQGTGQWHQFKLRVTYGSW